MVLKPKATSHSSNWADVRGYIHVCKKVSQACYLSTVNKSKEKGFTALRRDEFIMPSCKIKVPEILKNVKLETLLQTELNT